MSNLQLTSSAFKNNQSIPTRFTCEGENINPPLTISGVPGEAKVLALVVVDSDIPDAVKEKMGISTFDHWVVYDIDPSTKRITSGEVVGVQGQNSSGEVGYTGPCPPAQYEPTEHRYVFRLYALDKTVELSEEFTRSDLEGAVQGHVLDTAELVGLYEKSEV